jgi:hypothetical protein
VAKPPSPLVGFNNNVKHQGRIYHVQTEDSGVRRPHILTHLFVDGGRIIKSTRTDYSEHVGQPDMATVVRRLMKEQHKAMFIALRDGQLDDTIREVLGPPDGEAPPEPRKSRPPPLPSKRRSRPAPTLPDLTTQPVVTIPPAAAPPAPEPAAPRPVPRRAAPTLTDLVLADLEAARARKGAPEPPPPEKPASKGGTPILGTPQVPGRPQVSGRYGASRPAAIFSAPPDQGSIFGGSSISEQSLDEVILSYLAEDLDGSTED